MQAVVLVPQQIPARLRRGIAARILGWRLEEVERTVSSRRAHSSGFGAVTFRVDRPFERGHPFDSGTGEPS